MSIVPAIIFILCTLALTVVYLISFRKSDSSSSRHDPNDNSADVHIDIPAKSAPVSAYTDNASANSDNAASHVNDSVPSVNAHPDENIVTFTLPNNIDGAPATYTYNDVAFTIFLGNNFDAYLAKPLQFEKWDERILIKHEDIQIGYLAKGKLTAMLADWLDRSDPVRAFLTGLDYDKMIGKFTVVFYRDAVKHAQRWGADVKEFRLTGNRSPEIQEECQFASVGDRCTIEYDDYSERYEVRDESGSLYGYLPAPGAKFYEVNDGDCRAVVTNIDYDDNDRVMIYVTLIAY